MSQAATAEFARNHFADRISDIERLMPLFLNTGIESRYFAAPPEWFTTTHSLDEKNELYIRQATELTATAARQTIQQVGLEPADIDYLIYVNSTGLATPSIDARLINVLGLRTDIRRTPVWGLGCAGGAAGLSHAYHYLLGHPREKVLLAAAELCGLTFQADDFSKSNLVATALFADGAATVLLAGDEVDLDGLEIIATKSRLYPDSLDVMGWSVTSTGLQVVFAHRIPAIVEQNAAEDVNGFLAANDLELGDVEQLLFHPGGMKVLTAYRKALGLDNGQLDISTSVLRDFGNMSSVTVLFVLKRYLEQFGMGRGKTGLISALGPGFCSESLLVRL